MTIIGNCDCCERKTAVLHKAWVSGIETYACASCHGEDEDAFDDKLTDEDIKRRIAASRGECFRLDDMKDNGR